MQRTVRRSASFLVVRSRRFARTSSGAASQAVFGASSGILRLYLLAGVLWIAAASPPPVVAHDTWVQTNTSLIRIGDQVFLDLMLGNHGNDHRDFKLASKTDLARCTWEVVAPSGKRYDVKPQAIDLGYAPKEGFWASRFVAGESGLHMVAHTAVGGHGATRSIKSGKTFFLASASLDKAPRGAAGFDRVLGHPLEIVPLVNPVAPMGPGQELRVRLLYRGRPLAGERVSFVPRGVELAADFDPRYERLTDAQGEAAYTPLEGNYLLVVAHRLAAEEKGEGPDQKKFDETKYCATFTVLVPQVCACCDE